MKATYFKPTGEPAEKDFSLFIDAQSQGPVTTLQNPTRVSHKAYDEIVGKLKNLPPHQKEEVLKLAKDLSQLNRLSPQKAAELGEFLDRAKIEPSEMAWNILHDHATGGPARKEPVYSVNGKPVPQRAMSNVPLLSYEMGCNAKVAAALLRAYTESKTPEILIREIEKIGEIPSNDPMHKKRPDRTMIESMISTPIAHGLTSHFTYTDPKIPTSVSGRPNLSVLRAPPKDESTQAQTGAKASTHRIATGLASNSSPN